VGTTVWIDDSIRAELRRLQADFKSSSVNDTIRRPILRPALDARTLFALHHDAINTILLRHKVRRLVAFGSRARGDAGPTSDLDLAAELHEKAEALALLSVEAELEAALGIRVNLVELPNKRLARTLKREGVPFAA
jgi:predicted nucleotidyltransferase